MSFVIANLSEGLPQYFTLKENAGMTGKACFQQEAKEALHFARKVDAERFANAYYPFLSLTVQPHNVAA